MADEKILIEIDVNNEQAIKDINDQNKSINMLQKEQKELAKQGQKNSQRYQKNAADIQKLNSARRQNVKLITAEKGSLNELRANLARLTTERNNINASTEEGARKFRQLNEEILKQNESIKKAEQAGGDFRRNVGNYTDAIGDAIPALRGLNLAMLANPIGLIVAGFTALVAAFSKTEKGAKFLKTAMAVLNVVFDTLVGYVGEFAVGIVDAFSNPVESIKTFANLVQNYVLEKVNALIDTFGFLGETIKNLFQGDFEAALDSARKAGESFANANPYVDLFEATADAVVSVTEKVKENVEATIELEDATWKLQRSMLATQKEIKKLEGQEAVLASRAEDSTLSFQEQAQAQEELIEVQKRKFQQQENLIGQEINLIQTQLDIAKRNGQDTLAIQQELTTKQEELIGVRNQARLDETENLKITRQRNQDIWEQELDFIIDVGERERDILLERANNEELTIEQRKQALADYQANYDQFLQAQRSQFNEIGLSDEELNRLLGIKDPAELAQAITYINYLSEVQKNRLREVMIEFKNSELERAKAVEESSASITKTIQAEGKVRIETQKKVANAREQMLNAGFALAKQVASKNEKLVKAIGLVEVAVNTARGIMNAFATYGPTPVGYLTAASVAAIGATQALAITSASPSSSSTPTAPSSPSGSNTVTPNTSATDQALAEQAALESAIANIGLSISVTEINDAQSNVQVTQQTSTI